MASPFVQAANELLALYRPCVGFTFDPARPFGPMKGDLDEPLLNLGAAGAMLIMAKAETCTDDDIHAIMHFSSDRDELGRWLMSLFHTFNGTMPGTAELRALKALDEKWNAELYHLMGLFPSAARENSRPIR